MVSAQIHVCVVIMFYCFMSSVISYRWCHARSQTGFWIYDHLCPSEYVALSFTALNVAIFVVLCKTIKPGPHQQQCRRNIVECYNVERCFDIVAVFCNNVEATFDFVAKNGNNVERVLS